MWKQEKAKKKKTNQILKFYSKSPAKHSVSQNYVQAIPFCIGVFNTAEMLP